MVTEKPTCESQIEALVAYSRQQAEGSGLVDGFPESSLAVELPGYAIVEQIGGGGQGTVFRAVQRTTNREVAIKILHSGSLGRRLDGVRFEREIKALALLQHPGIVRLVDGGTVERRRFLVMDFIEGESLDEYLREEAPPIRERVELMVRVCDAVAAAHVRGVVHRDLKPSNVRVDRAGHPHVLDFGLARLLDSEGDIAGNREATLTGQFLGSPSWASPEQAEGAISRIDTRTDVYALGLLLYHGITGDFPYPIGGPLNDTLNHIRLTAPGKLRVKERSIDADLETIVLKCLNKEQGRRYQSAGELAAELRRYLAGEPIEARRDSMWYVLSRTLGQHRMTTAVVLGFLLLLLAYALTTTVLYQRAVTANAEAVTSRRELQETASIVVSQLAEGMSRVPRGSVLQKTMYETAQAQLVKLLGHDVDDPRLLADRAAALIGLSDIALAVGDSEGALGQREQALTIHRRLVDLYPDEPQRLRDLAVSVVLVGDISKHRSDYEGALKWYQEALGIHEDLVASEPENVGYLDDLAWSYERIGDMIYWQGDINRSEEYFLKRRELAERLAALEPAKTAHLQGLITSLGWLGTVASSRGDGDSARAMRLEAINAAERLHAADSGNPKYTLLLASALDSEGNVLSDEDRLEEAEPMFTRSRVLIEQLLKNEPTNVVNRAAFAGSLCQAGRVHEKRQDLESAWAAYKESAAVLDELLKADSENLEHLVNSMDLHARLGHTGRQLGLGREATNATAEATATARRLLDLAPADPHRIYVASEWLSNCCENPQCDPAHGLAAAQHGVELAPEKFEMWLALAKAMESNGRCDDAVAAAMRGLALLTEHDRIRCALFEDVVRRCQERGNDR
jgi:tetratricopeptide (TPR) repeat protein